MLLTQMTLNDLRLLNLLRVERLRSLFAQTLLECPMYIDRDTAIVHCSHAAIVDNLLIELAELSEYVWLILGVRSLAVFFRQEQIYYIKCGEACNDLRELC